MLEMAACENSTAGRLRHHCPCTSARCGRSEGAVRGLMRRRMGVGFGREFVSRLIMFSLRLQLLPVEKLMSRENILSFREVYCSSLRRWC